MQKRYNLIFNNYGKESVFLSYIHISSLMKNSGIELVGTGFSEVYHVLDSTAKFDRELQPDLLHPLKRTNFNPLLEIHASNKRKIKKAIRLLEEITSQSLEEAKK